jgi:3-hydroxy-5-methyl-1-naphthoate 3-O-methyltransferase
MALDPTIQPGAVNTAEKNLIHERMFGFADIKILQVAINLRLVHFLSEQPMSEEELAKKAGVPSRGVGYMLIGLGGMGMIAYADGKYRPSELGAKYLVETSPFFYGQAIRYWEWTAEAFSRLEESVREDKPVWEGFAHYLKEVKSDTGTVASADRQQVFYDSISLSMMFVANSVLTNVDLSDAKRLFDVGGSLGRFVMTAVTRHPKLHATVFDLAPVCEQAKQKAAEAGLSDRIDTYAGDFVEGPWPKGYDVITFLRILNTRERPQIVKIVRHAFDALPSGGRLVFVDSPVLGNKRGTYGQLAGRQAVLLSIKARGSIRHEDEWVAILKEGGFPAPEQIVNDDPFGIMVLRKP